LFVGHRAENPFMAGRQMGEKHHAPGSFCLGRLMSEGEGDALFHPVCDGFADFSLLEINHDFLCNRRNNAGCQEDREQ
jgi:hypothetical protein